MSVASINSRHLPFERLAMHFETAKNSRDDDATAVVQRAQAHIISLSCYFSFGQESRVRKSLRYGQRFANVRRRQRSYESIQNRAEEETAITRLDGLSESIDRNSDSLGRKIRCVSRGRALI